MNKLLRTMIISMLLMIILPMVKLSAQVSTWDGSWESWTHGTGTEADPFLIENAPQLAYLAYRVNNGLDAGGGHVSNHNYHYKLMVDVDLNGSDTLQWTPIGYWNSDLDYQCFGGYFDGNNHIITNVYINNEANRVGLFGFVDGGTITQVHINSGSISTTGKHAGGIIGASLGTINIMHCSNNTAVFSNENTGGIIGIISNTNSTTYVSNCQNSGNVSSGGYGYCSTGGIIGDNYSSSDTTIIENCFNIGNVTSSCSGSGAWRYVGGIIALNHFSSVNITNCYNTGSVSLSGPGGYYWASGILGANNAGTATITSCYNVGILTSSGTNIGGISWQQVEGGGGGGSVNISNSYYLNTCGGYNTYGGLAMTNTQMRDPQFVTTLNQGQATPVWILDYAIPINDGYPILQWQQITGVEEKEPLSVAVYPNPTNNHVTISAECLKRITISNLFGQVIYENNVNGNTFEYDFSGYSEGLYLIRIETANGIVTKRVAVTR